MTTTTQHGRHPDVEQLSAFAEQTLPEHERNRVLAHLAVCSRCRQVVALSACAIEAEPRTLVAAAAAASVHGTAARRPPYHWWNRRRLVWIPAAVVAAFTLASVSVYHRRPKESGIAIEIAKQTAPQAVPAAPPSTEHGESNPHIPAPIEKPYAAPKRARPEPVLPAQLSEKAQLQPRSESFVDSESLAVAGSAGAAPIPRVLRSERAPAPLPTASANETVAVASYQPGPETVSAQQSDEIQPPYEPLHGGLSATPPPSAASPVSAQLQKEREKKFAEFDRSVEAAENSDHLAATRTNPEAASVGTAVSGSNKSAAPYAQPAGSQSASIASFGAVHGFSSNARLAAVPIQLPSGLALASIASSGHLVLAVDESGGLFLTQDSGLTWRQVAPQWSGRAVLVRTRSLLTPHGFTAPAAEFDGKPSSGPTPSSGQSIVFEVVNEKNQVWQSADGLVWIAKQASPGP